jgi:hypothetical protein
MTNSKFGDSVAAEMDRILSDDNFKSIFAKAEQEYTDIVKQDPSYQAFVRIAKKKECKECKKEPCKCKAKDKKEDKKDKKEDKKDKKKVKKAEEEVLAIKYIYDTVLQASEALDNMGFSKSASDALGLLGSIIKEAQMGDTISDTIITPIDPEVPEIPGAKPKQPNPLKNPDTDYSKNEPEVLSADDGTLPTGKEEFKPGFGTKEKKYKDHEPPATDTTKVNRPSTFKPNLGPKKPANSESLHVGASITDKNIIALYNKINEWSKKG